MCSLVFILLLSAPIPIKVSFHMCESLCIMHHIPICMYANPFVHSGFDSDWPCECYFERKHKQEKHLCVWMYLNSCVPAECQDAKVLLWPRTSGSVTVAHSLCRRAKVSSDVSSDLEDDSTPSAAVRCDIEPDGCCCLDRCKYSEHLKLVSKCQSKQTGAAGPVSCVWYVCVFVFVSGWTWQ